MRNLVVVLAAGLLLAGCGRKPRQTEQAAGNTETPVETQTKRQAYPMPDLSSLDLTTTPSGLQYADLVVGEGTQPKTGQTAEVHYTLWLEDGKLIQRSRDHGQPFSFQLNTGQVIKGWDEGVSGMHAGGKRVLVIPPDLAYGERGAGGMIPPNATIVFEVELLEVK